MSGPTEELLRAEWRRGFMVGARYLARILKLKPDFDPSDTLTAWLRYGDDLPDEITDYQNENGD